MVTFISTEFGQTIPSDYDCRVDNAHSKPTKLRIKILTLLGNTVYFSKKGKSNWVRYSSPMLLNTNSVKNKYDELKRLNNEIKSHIIFISETKIDSSYPNGQFALSSYTLYHPAEVERKEMWTQRTLWL